MAIEETMLTTVDNPYSPFTQPDEWRSFDVLKGYYTNEYLARVAYTSNDLSDEDEIKYIDEAMNDIVRLNPLLYKIVTPSTEIKPVNVEALNVDD